MFRSFVYIRIGLPRYKLSFGRSDLEEKRANIVLIQDLRKRV